MSAIHTLITSTQVTFLVPPPAGAVQEQIPNQQLQETVSIQSSEVDNPGLIQPPVADSFARLADPWTVNPNLTQYFPVNAPPTP